MKRRVLLKASVCFAAMALLLLSMMGLCLAGGLLEDTPVGDALDKLDETVDEVVDVLLPDDGAQAPAEATGSGGLSSGAPAADAQSAPDPAAVPGLDTLTGALDPAAVPGLDTLTGALDPAAVPGLDTLTGALDPGNLPGADTLPDAGDLPLASLPSLPGMDGLPGMPGLPADPMQVLQIVDRQNQLFVVLDLDGLAKAKVGLGKNLQKAPLLALQVILFDALAVEGSLGIEKIDDNAFLVPLELYLKYMAGEEGWKEILDVVVPLELSFPGAGMVPDAVQKIIDTLYEYILKPILSLLPIYRGVEPEPVTPKPAVPSLVPPTEVLGEVVASPAGGSGDHLPFTGAALTVLFILIVSLAVGGFLLSRLERTVRRRAG